MQVYRCTQCSQTFSRSDLLAEHSARHVAYQERPFPCLVCGKRFTEKKGLNDHAAVHNTDRPRYPCEVAGCTKSFLNQKSALLHVVQMHPNVHLSAASARSKSAAVADRKANAPATNERSSCEATVPLSTEVAAESARSMARHACEVADCGKVFQTAYYLRVHTRWHRGLPPYECSACSSAFTTAKALKAHRDGPGHHLASRSSNSAEKRTLDQTSASSIKLGSSQPTPLHLVPDFVPKPPLNGPAQLRGILTTLRALARAPPADNEGSENRNESNEARATVVGDWQRNFDVEAFAELVCGNANSIERMAPNTLWDAVFPPAGTSTALVANRSTMDASSIAANISVAADHNAMASRPSHTRKRIRMEATQGCSDNISSSCSCCCCCRCCCSSDSCGPELHSVASQAVPHVTIQASRGTSPDPSHVPAVGKCSVSSGPGPLDTLYLEAMAGSDLVNPLESHDFPVEATTSPIPAGSTNNRSIGVGREMADMLA